MTLAYSLWGPAEIGKFQAFTGGDYLAAYALDDADDSIGQIFFAPKSGTISKVGFYMTQVDGAPSAYNVGLVTVDSSGRPTTTALAAGSTTTYLPNAANVGWVWVDLPTPASVTVSQPMAVHVWPVSGGTYDASNRMWVVNDDMTKTPAGTCVYFGTGWISQAASTALAVLYSDGEVFGYSIRSRTVLRMIRSTSTPDELGARFVLPMQMTCIGVMLPISYLEISAQFVIRLYDELNTVLTSALVADKDYVDDTVMTHIFWSPVVLSGSTPYRVAVEATVGTNGGVRLFDIPFVDASYKQFMPRGEDWQTTERTNGGAWTDTSDNICPFALLVNSFDLVATVGGIKYWGYVG